MCISHNLDVNICALDTLFADCADVVSRKIYLVGGTQAAFLIYLDNLSSRDEIEMHIIRPLVLSLGGLGRLDGNVFEHVLNRALTTVDYSEKDSLGDCVNALLMGDTLILVDGFSKGIVVSTKGWPGRGVQSAENEVVLQGSKEAFTETLRTNSVLVRRRIRDTRLKLKQKVVGVRSRTDVGIMYMEGVVREDILKELERRLELIEIDAIMDVGYIEQLLEDDWLSPFPQFQTTERPDKAAAAILEGRIVVLVDNSPLALILPATLNTFMQAAEDYYQGWQIMSMVRLLRFVAAFMGLALPALYISVAVYHPSMLPTLLIYKLAEARRDVPFPAALEVILMDFAFELLREAGVRLPGAIGGTIGIVGGLIIGQAAVEAGLVSPIVVIIVAITGLCTFVIPSFQLVNGLRVMKYVLIFFAATLGIFGFWIGMLFVIIHLASLKSFGIPYMTPFVSVHIPDTQDSVFRAPLFMLRNRPIFSNPTHKVRQAARSTGKQHSRE